MASINAARKPVESKEMPENLKFQREKDRTPVRGKFIYHEVPGGSMEFNYRKYKGDPIEKFSMVDGGIYTIPLGVAKHLNSNGWYPIHAFAKNENGMQDMKIGQKVRRFSFQSLEFIDVEGVAPVGSPTSGIENV